VGSDGHVHHPPHTINALASLFLLQDTVHCVPAAPRVTVDRSIVGMSEFWDSARAEFCAKLAVVCTINKVVQKL